MNKTFTINISDIIFNINDDAYETLNQYLLDLKNHFSKDEESEEIMNDIESRIAEIFSEKTSGSNSIITIIDVNHVIVILGKVEDIDGDQNEENQSKSSEKTKKNNYTKKLYRDVDDKSIAGVAKGLSYYLGVDVSLIRIIFILLAISGTAGIWIYIILWAATPEAKTSIEKLEMKGEPVNLSNLEKTIKEGFENVSQKIKDKNLSKNVSNIFDKLLQIVISIISGVLSVIKYSLGSVAVFLGVIFLSIMVAFFLFNSTIISIGENQVQTIAIQEILYHFSNPETISYLTFSLIVIIGIPILSLIYFGVKLLFGIKNTNKSIGIIMLIFWIFSMVIFSIASINIAKEFSHQKHKKETLDFNCQSNNLYLKIVDNSESINSEDVLFTCDDESCIITKSEFLLEPNVSIEESEDSLYHVSITKSAFGKNKFEASKNLSAMDYMVRFDNDSLIFNLYHKITPPFRAQEIEINIRKPKATEIQTNNETIINERYYNW